MGGAQSSKGKGASSAAASTPASSPAPLPRSNSVSSVRRHRATPSTTSPSNRRHSFGGFQPAGDHGDEACQGDVLYSDGRTFIPKYPQMRPVKRHPWEVRTGQYLLSPSGRWRARVDEGGRLVVDDSVGDVAFRSDNEPRKRFDVYRLDLAENGALRVLRGLGKDAETVWDAGTDKLGAPGPFRLRMQDDRNLVLYCGDKRVVWASMIQPEELRFGSG